MVMNGNQQLIIAVRVMVVLFVQRRKERKWPCMAKRKSRSPEGLKAEINSLIKQRDELIERFAKDFATALYDEGIATKLSGYNKRELRRVIHYMSEDIDRYVERLEEERKVLSENGREAAKRRGSKKPVNIFDVPLSDEEFEKMVAMLEANKANSESQG